MYKSQNEAIHCLSDGRDLAELHFQGGTPPTNITLITNTIITPNLTSELTCLSQHSARFQLTMREMGPQLYCR